MSTMKIRSGTVRVAAIACLAGMVCGAAAQVQVQPEYSLRTISAAQADASESYRVVYVRDGIAQVPMLLSNTEQPKTRAAMAIEIDTQDKARQVADGYTLHNELIVVADSIESVREVIAELAPGSSVTALGGIEGWATVRVGTVAMAIELADKLHPLDAIESVSVVRETPKTLYALPNDPFVNLQWSILNTATTNSDHGLSAVWDMGYTGEGITVAVLEVLATNFQKDHPDLDDNLNNALSHEYSEFIPIGHPSVAHATSVAGIIAAEGDNGEGVAGMAYNADLVGLNNGAAPKTIDAFLWKTSEIDLMNHSWGLESTIAAGVVNPFFAFVGLNTNWFNQTSQALMESANRGQIHVFASGNSNLFEDARRLNAGNVLLIDDQGFLLDSGYLDNDGILISTPIADFGDRTEYSSLDRFRNTIAIGAAGDNNRITWYSTTGNNLLAAAYSESAAVSFDAGSSGGSIKVGRSTVTTAPTDGTQDATDPFYPVPSALPDGYTAQMNGTSAAAPAATGIIALMLEANSELDIRDIKTIIKETADWTRIPSALGEIQASQSGDGRYIIPSNVGPNASSLWQVNGGFVPHSDQFGFGIIDAEAAVSMADSYTGSPPLVILDTGVVTMDASVADAEYVLQAPLNSVIVPGELTFDIFCVKPNMLIEDIEVTVTIEGRNAGDLMIWIQSPQNTTSILSIPRLDGTEIFINGKWHTHYEYTFNTLKHWGELSGGNWFIGFQDFAPDADLPVGTLDGDPPAVQPHVVNLGTFGRPGQAIDATEKTVASYRMRIFSSDAGEDPFWLCGGLSGISCPGDINGDGIVDIGDLLLFLDWWEARSLFADLNGDGFVDSTDLIAFFNSFIVNFGPCDKDPNNGGPSRPIDDGRVIPIG